MWIDGLISHVDGWMDKLHGWIERKKKKHKRAVQGGKGAGGLDLRSGGGPSEEARPSVTKNKEGKKTKNKRVDQQLSSWDGDDAAVVDSDGNVNPKYL